MEIKKPDHCLLLQSYHVIDNQPLLFISLGYVVDQHQHLLAEQEVWPWLLSSSDQEPIDLVFKKKHGTFAVVGKAYANREQGMAEKMAVTAQIGALKKSVYVFGDRYWEQGLTGWRSSDPRPFSSLPLDLSTAFGGEGYPCNPYGKGYSPSGVQVGSPLPNVERIDQLILSPDDTPPPATFRALPVSSPDKQRWLGQVDELWQQHHFPWLPVDTDARWFDGVPEDQVQPSYWQGTESWSVQGMHPEKHEVSGVLPGLRPRLVLRQTSATLAETEKLTEAELDLDTIWLFPNEQRVLLWYRAAIAVSREDAADVLALMVLTENNQESKKTIQEVVEVWAEPTVPEVLAANSVVLPAIPLSAEAVAFQEELIAGIKAEFAEQIQKVNQHLAQLATQTPIEIPPIAIDLPEIEATLLTPQGIEAEDADLFSQQLQQDIERELAQARQQAEASLREIARHTGLDEESLIEMSRSASKPTIKDDRQVIDLLAQAPIDADLRELLQQKMEQQNQQEQHILQQLESAQSSDSFLEAEDDFPSDSIAILSYVAQGGVLAGRVLTNLSFARMDLTQVSFEQAILEQCCFDGACLKQANFNGARVKSCSFQSVDAIESTWLQADLLDSDFTDAKLNTANFSQVTSEGSVFNQANLANAILEYGFFQSAEFNHAQFCQALLTGVSFIQCQLKNADFSASLLKDARFAEQSDATGAVFTNAMLMTASLQNTCFNEADFSYAELSHVFIKQCSFERSQAAYCIAKHIEVLDSQFVSSQWPGANLMHASFRHTHLLNVDFRGTNLFGVEARTAQITGVLLEGAFVERSAFSQYLNV